MGPMTESLRLYQDLADAYEKLGQVTMRDRFLMLAADAAMQMSQPGEAERLRQRLLVGSRHHMLRPYASFAEASAAPDVQTYLRDLRLNYPPDVAASMLASLQGAGEPRLDQTQPVPVEPTRAIPVTAPVVDMTAPRPRPSTAAPRPLVPETYPLADPAPPRPRSPASRPATPAASPAPLKVVPPPAAPERGPRNKAAWLNAVLLVVVFVAGLAAAALTVARPFLPDRLLP